MFLRVTLGYKYYFVKTVKKNGVETDDGADAIYVHCSAYMVARPVN